MKIGIACTNAIPVPVPQNEIYANQDITGWIADELAIRGYDVTLFAPIGSETKAKLVTFDMLPFSNPLIYGRYTNDKSFFDYENLFVSKVYRYAEENDFDLLHMHLRPLNVAPFAAMSHLPTLQTIHDPLTFSSLKILELYNEFENLNFASISFSQRKAMPDLNIFDNVYNGINLKKWKFNPQGGEKLCQSGRVIREKGTHGAMEIARKMGLKLQIAGFIYEFDKSNEKSYWNTQVKPLLGDDITLDYFSQDNLPDFYGHSKAFINTLDWEEPFGLVMIEAMACGTPVIAYNRGSVSEVVKDGVTGFVVDTPEEMMEAIKNIDSIKREDCRKHVEENFSVEKMTDNYLAAYKGMLESRKRG
ncbi:MAG: glycosyltransferase family 4 protein [Candidatus Pacebacteria bacterium]|nr:glycosyltransferase family 4 protein [Candidatus Paceibacterota bacterium]